MLSPKSTPPSARIERWLLYLQQFCYVIKHIAGKENSADVLSRLPVDPPENRDAVETREYAFSIANEAVPAALTAHEVERASEKDPTLQLVREAITSGDWSHLSGTMYKALAEELWVLGQLVLRGNRIVMPESLWKRTIELCPWGPSGNGAHKSQTPTEGVVAQHGQADWTVHPGLPSLPAGWAKK